MHVASTFLHRGLSAAIIDAADPAPVEAGADPADWRDASIRASVLAALARQPWWQPLTASVFVHQGVVIYQGLYRRRAERSAARILAQGIAGVRAVRDDRRPVREWQALA